MSSYVWHIENHIRNVMLFVVNARVGWGQDATYGVNAPGHLNYKRYASDLPLFSRYMIPII